MTNISVVINVVDAELPFLEGALSSVKILASEIVLIDMTFEKKAELAKIAKKFNACVYSHTFVLYVEPVRNFGISKANGDWILIMDPDERLNPRLIKKLKTIVSKNECDYLNIPRKNMVFGKWIKHSRWWPDYNVRFFKKGKVEWGERIHSIPVTSGIGKDLLPKEKNAIEHLHYSTVEQFIERMNRYTTQQAKNLHSENVKFSWYKILSVPVKEFNSRFFMGEGYKDGLHGLALCSLQSFSEMVTIVKLWQLEKFFEKSLNADSIASEFRKNIREQNYWISDLLIKTSSFNFIERIRRKLKM